MTAVTFKKTGYGKGRTVLEVAANEPGKWNKKVAVIQKYNEKLDWGDLPDEVVLRFKPLSNLALKRFARSASKYGKGTYERHLTYRIREAFNIKFEAIGGFSFFHPQDQNDSPLGIFMGREREPEVDTMEWEDEE